ncbi:MAG: hypothetical protein J6L71_01135, partial [Clostridia bacterium]|nr:hypothetical protein [Clostridia bacterium]
MDIKEKIEELVEKIKNDDDLLKNFKEEPVKTIEKLIGIDLPDDQIEAVIDGIKTKLDIEDLKDKLGDIGGALKGLGGLFG